MSSDHNVQEPPPIEALAADIATRLQEVEEEQAARRAAHAEEDAKFGVELDSDTATRRRSGAPAYADTWLSQISAYCDEASAIIGSVCTRRRSPAG